MGNKPVTVAQLIDNLAPSLWHSCTYDFERMKVRFSCKSPARGTFHISMWEMDDETFSVNPHNVNCPNCNKPVFYEKKMPDDVGTCVWKYYTAPDCYTGTANSAMHFYAEEMVKDLEGDLSLSIFSEALNKFAQLKGKAVKQMKQIYTVYFVQGTQVADTIDVIARNEIDAVVRAIVESGIKTEELLAYTIKTKQTQINCENYDDEEE